MSAGQGVHSRPLRRCATASASVSADGLLLVGGPWAAGAQARLGACVGFARDGARTSLRRTRHFGRKSRRWCCTHCRTAGGGQGRWGEMKGADERRMSARSPGCPTHLAAVAVVVPQVDAERRAKRFPSWRGRHQGVSWFGMAACLPIWADCTPHNPSLQAAGDTPGQKSLRLAQTQAPLLQDEKVVVQ